MTELPKRFNKDEVYRAQVPYRMYSGAEWMDIPGVIDDDHILANWNLDYGDGTTSDRVAERISNTSSAIAITQSDADLLIAPYSPESYKETLRIKQLLEEFEADPMYSALVEPLRNILKDSIDLDWVKFQKRVTELGRVARSRTELYVGGMELWTDHRQGSEPAFAGRFRGLVTIKASDELFTLEPIIEGKDGSHGLFPRGVSFRGLYHVREDVSWAKKLRFGVAEEDLPEKDKIAFEKAKQDWEAEDALKK